MSGKSILTSADSQGGNDDLEEVHHFRGVMGEKCERMSVNDVCSG